MENERGAQTNVCGDACKNDLAFASCFDCLSELGIIPSIDFTISFDKRGIGIKLGYLLGKGTIGPLLGASGEDNRDFEKLSNSRMGNEVISELRRSKVPDLSNIMNRSGDSGPGTVLTRWKSPTWRSAITTTCISD